MKHVSILIASVRDGRKSNRVGYFFQNYINSKLISAQPRQNPELTVDIIDLKEYSFPIFTERYKYTPNPEPNVIEFRDRIIKADGLIIVTPEYNGGYPASLKNVTDLLYEEWRHKPMVIATVSDGDFGGTQVITSLLFTLWKIGANVLPVRFPVQHDSDAFDEEGNPADKEKMEKFAAGFVGALLKAI